MLPCNYYNQKFIFLDVSVGFFEWGDLENLCLTVEIVPISASVPMLITICDLGRRLVTLTGMLPWVSSSRAIYIKGV
jgi:hypothetical protein